MNAWCTCIVCRHYLRSTHKFCVQLVRNPFHVCEILGPWQSEKVCWDTNWCTRRLVDTIPIDFCWKKKIESSFWLMSVWDSLKAHDDSSSDASSTVRHKFRIKWAKKIQVSSANFYSFLIDDSDTLPPLPWRLPVLLFPWLSKMPSSKVCEDRSDCGNRYAFVKSFKGTREKSNLSCCLLRNLVHRLCHHRPEHVSDTRQSPIGISCK